MFTKIRDKKNYSNLLKTVIEYGLYRTMNIISDTVDIEIEDGCVDDRYTIPKTLKEYEQMDVDGKKAFIHRVWMNYLQTRNHSNLLFMQVFNKNIIKCGSLDTSILSEYLRNFVSLNTRSAFYLKLISILINTSSTDVIAYTKKLIKRGDGVEYDISLYMLYNDHIQHFRDSILYYIIEFYKASYEVINEVNVNMNTIITLIDSEFHDDVDIDLHDKIKIYMTNHFNLFNQPNATSLWSNYMVIQSIIDKHVAPDIIQTCYTSNVDKSPDGIVTNILLMCDKIGYGVLKYIEELFEIQDLIYIRLIWSSPSVLMVHNAIMKEVTDVYFTSIHYHGKPKPTDILDSIPYHVEPSNLIAVDINGADYVQQRHVYNMILKKIAGSRNNTIYKYAKKLIK